jgi:SAM-dependent methyltransferase
MDELAGYNRERWNELSLKGIAYARPWLDLTPDTAYSRIDPEGALGGMSLAGTRVLCLAGGGGQQSAAFGLLGARVTVFDLSEVQLSKDAAAARHYGLEVETIQGDMRDLSPFEDGSFDLIWHAHSLNFVPDPRPVFRGVARILRGGGWYRMSYSNPFYHGMLREKFPDGCYRLCLPYEDGAEITWVEPEWTFRDEAGRDQAVVGPKEFRHTLGTVVNEAFGVGLQMLGFYEDMGPPGDFEPGTWEHSLKVAPQFVAMWYRRA